MCGSLTFLAGAASANELPAVPEGGLLRINDYACVDQETQLKGHCFIKQDLSGQMYLAFTQNREVMFIRKFDDDGYETIWMNDKFNSF